MLHLLFKWLIWIASSYVLLMVMMYWVQRYLLYRPINQPLHPEQWQVADMRVVKLQTADGLTLTAWFKAAQPNHPTFLYFHGNAGHLGMRGPKVRYFLDQGYGVLLLSYRGYGGNPGFPSENGLYQDAEAAIAFLIQTHQVSPACLILYGESLGTGVAVEMAKRYPVSALILQAPYTTMAEVAAWHYPWLPVHWLLKDRYDSMAKIASIQAPLLVMHGAKDKVVPTYMGERLGLAAKPYKAVKIYPDKAHSDIWTPVAAQDVSAFVQEHVRCARSASIVDL